MIAQKLEHALTLITEIKSGIPEGGRLEAIEHIIEKAIRAIKDHKILSSKTHLASCGDCGSQPVLRKETEDSILKYLQCPKCGNGGYLMTNDVNDLTDDWNEHQTSRINRRIANVEVLEKKIKRFEDFFEPIRELLDGDDNDATDD